MKLLILLAVAFLFAELRYSRADGVDDYVKQQMQQRHIPGLSLAIVKNGKIIKAKGYGLANVELNVPATKDTVYEIGPVTKVFTATAMMMLVNDGKIGLDDKITNYLSGLPQTWNEITVRHLLSHASGIIRHYRTCHGRWQSRANQLSTPTMALRVFPTW